MMVSAMLPPEVLQVFESLPDWYFVLSPEFMILTVSDAYLKAAGTWRTALISKHLFEVFPTLKGENLAPALQQVLITKKPHQLLGQRYLVPLSATREVNLEEKCADVLITPVLDQTGAIAYLILKVQETTVPHQQNHCIPQEHQRMKEALAINHIGSFEWNNPEGISYWSEEMYRLHGLEPSGEPITLDRLFSATHPEDRVQLKEAIQKAQILAGIYSITHRVIHPDGSIRYLKRVFQSWAHSAGPIKSVKGTVQDITEQQQAQEQVQEQANFIHQVTTTMPDMVSVIELATGDLEYINQESLPLSGFTYEGLKDVTPAARQNLIHPEDQSAVMAYFASFATTADEEVQMLEYRARDHSVEWQWFLVRGRVFRRNEDGQATHCLNVVQNITPRKKAQAEISRHLLVLQQAEEVAGMGSWEYDLASGVFQWSAGMYRLFGIKEGTSLTLNILLEYVLGKDYSITQELIQHIQAGQEPLEQIIRIRKDEQVRILKVKAQVTRNLAGQPVKVIGVDLDVTEIMRLEQENLDLKLGQQKALLLAIMETQEEERRRISESLHNGVGQILYATKLQLNQIDLPKSTPPTPSFIEAKKMADYLLSEAIRETRQVSHELIPLLLEEQGLEIAIADFCNRFALTGIQFICYGLKQRLERPLEIAIYRIAQELVNNIVKHAQATRARIEVYQEEDFIILEAQDDGQGMKVIPASRPGIGLKTIQDRVELLEGTLEIDSSPGKGTLITISLPLVIVR